LPPPHPEAGSGARALLSRHGLRAKKSWGQNFLVDPNVRRRIVAAAGPGVDDVVVEIGAGLGAITAGLAEAAGRVIAIERDPDLVPLLEAELAARGNVTVSPTDALVFDFAAAARQAGRPLVVVGNLPYQITSPLLFAILEAGAAIARAVLMVQREVAERIVAAPGSKTYGRLSVMAQQQAAVEILFHVGAGAFHPRPAVTSTVMRATPRPAPLAAVADSALFATVVRAAFSTRRKMLRRALAPTFGHEPARAALARAGIADTRRAEELSVAELARLASALAGATIQADPRETGETDDA
jgi:16S rRNA (adenine1518-N6/adenine1519-N6)-dimethyltransferase